VLKERRRKASGSRLPGSAALLDILMDFGVLLWPLRATSRLDGIPSSGYSREVILVVGALGIWVGTGIGDALQYCKETIDRSII
jgi:hypothetical protein